MTVPTLQQQRTQILKEMASIDHMIRGHISTQTYRVKRHGQVILQGPYHVLQRHQDGRNQCQRIRDQELDLISSQVLAYKRYMELVERFAALTEQISWKEQPETVKKSSTASGSLFPQNGGVPEPDLGPRPGTLCRLRSRVVGGRQSRRSQPLRGAAQ